MEQSNPLEALDTKELLLLIQLHKYSYDELLIEEHPQKHEMRIPFDILSETKHRIEEDIQHKLKTSIRLQYKIGLD